MLYCNRFRILFTQIIHKKQTQKIKKTFLLLQYSPLKRTVVQHNSWYPGAGIEWAGKKSYWLEEGEEVGDGRAEGSSATGDGGQAAIPLTPDTDGTHVRILESSQLEGSYVGDLTVLCRGRKSPTWNHCSSCVEVSPPTPITLNCQICILWPEGLSLASGVLCFSLSWVEMPRNDGAWGGGIKGPATCFRREESTWGYSLLTCSSNSLDDEGNWFSPVLAPFPQSPASGSFPPESPPRTWSLVLGSASGSPPCYHHQRKRVPVLPGITAETAQVLTCKEGH